MKNIIILAVAVIGITTASCRKERTCECKTTQTRVTSQVAGPQTTVTTYSDKVTTEKQHKKQFVRDNSCYSRQYTDISNDGKTQTTYDVSCDLN